MSRLMSVSHTEAAVVARTKTVTRRLGWTFLRPGDRLTLCRKVMGRKPDEPLVRLAEVEVVSVRREPVAAITREDILREGVPVERWTSDDQHIANCDECAPIAWSGWFARTMRCDVYAPVNRIEWRYLS